MHPMLLTLPRWRLTPTPIGIGGLDPAGTVAFCSIDLGEILDTLGPTTPLTERIAACAAGWLGFPPSTGAPDPDRPHAYICSPFAAPTPDVQAHHMRWARALARLAWDHGFWPVAPTFTRRNFSMTPIPPKGRRASPGVSRNSKTARSSMCWTCRPAPGCVKSSTGFHPNRWSTSYRRRSCDLHSKPT